MESSWIAGRVGSSGIRDVSVIIQRKAYALQGTGSGEIRGNGNSLTTEVQIHPILLSLILTQCAILIPDQDTPSEAG
jgi:hypothetical protein